MAITYFQFFAVMLRHPLLLGPLVLTIAILFGVGRQLGLPLLFWHERASHRFWAGLASTALAAELFFVGYLLEQAETVADVRALGRFYATGGAVWLAVVAAAAVVRSHRFMVAGGAGVRSRLSSEAGVTPGIQTTSDGRRGAVQSVQVPVTAFVVGACTAVLAVAGLLALWLFVPLPPVGEALLARVPSCRRVADPRLHLITLAGFILLAGAFVGLKRHATPAIGLCMLLALVGAAAGALSFWTCSTGAGLLVLLALLAAGGWPRYKLRLPTFDALYAAPTVYPPPILPELPLLPGLALPPGERRKLILVCTSGGGIRSATWTAAILGRLDEIAGARAAVRLITGASGGMMGAATWVAALARQSGDPRAPAPDGSWKRMTSAVAMDSLTPLARRLFFHDVPLAFWPARNRQDRGLALERAWCDNVRGCGIDLDLPFGDLRAGEAEGRWPSLVFSPMLVEDGRRLLITNLDLRAVTDNEVRWLAVDGAGPPGSGISSRGAIHLAELFPERWAELPLSTAARLSAAFPYVSPGVVLPTEPRRRVVDAGYFDNYGLDLLCNWLREALELRPPWLAALSGVLVIQIRDDVSHLSLNPERRRAAPVQEKDPRLGRGFEGLTTPPAAVLGAREAATLFRNDAELETVTRLYAAATGNPNFLTTSIFEFRGEASLSWYLTEAETHTLVHQAASPGISRKLGAIAAWMSS